jgi:hypothetical protein
MIAPVVETTSVKTAKVKYKKKWLKLRTNRSIDNASIWMFIDGSSTGWHAAIIIDSFANKITRITKFKESKNRNIGPELRSLLIGLRDVDPTKPLTVVIDFIGTAAWLIGAWSIKSDTVRDLINHIREVIKSRNFCSIKFIHHGSHQKDYSHFTKFNNEADKLCNEQKVLYSKVNYNFEDLS